LAGSGDTAVTAGSGADDSVFRENMTAATGGSYVAIAGFFASDISNLSSYGANTASIALADAVTRDGNTTVALLKHAWIMFPGTRGLPT
jgi:hypothetical protein